MSADRRLSADRYGIGGSDIAGILRVARYTSEYRVWAKALGLIEDQAVTDEMAMGTLLEPTLARLFAERTGLYVTGHEWSFRHPRATWARAHIDDLAFDGPVDEPTVELALGGVEYKTDRRHYGWDEIPDDYEAQARWYMLLTGLPHWWFGVLHAGLDFRVYELVRDPDLEGRIARAAGYFWHRRVRRFDPPPADGSKATHDTLAEVFAEGGKPSLELEHRADIEAVAAWKRARAERLAAAAVEDAAANQVTALLGNHEDATVDGELVVSWRRQETNRLDTKALRAAQPELAELFTTTTTGRVLRAHGSED